MSDDMKRQFHAGDALQDLCRVCKAVRGHTVIVADAGGGALRVICDYCGSQHNFRGGEPEPQAAAPARGEPARAGESGGHRERSPSTVELETRKGGPVDLERVLRRVIRDELGLTPVEIAARWRDGELVLRPRNRELQEKSWAIETFFHKVVMLRNRLRVLEQQVNNLEIPEDLKVKFQAYITGCYGTLTSFNVLFADEEDRFRSGPDHDKD